MYVHVHVHVCMYVCTCICMYVCIYVCLYVSMCMRINNVYVFVCIIVHKRGILCLMKDNKVLQYRSKFQCYCQDPTIDIHVHVCRLIFEKHFLSLNKFALQMLTILPFCIGSNSIPEDLNQ